MKDSRSLVLSSRTIPLVELADFIDKERITVATLVAIAMNGRQEVEIQYLHGYPASVTEKRDLVVKATPGFSHVASIQRASGVPPLIEGEPELMLDPHVVNFVTTLTAAVVAKTTARSQRGIQDLFLVTPVEHDEVESFMIDVVNNTAKPLWLRNGTEEAITNPRLSPWGGLLATRGKELLYFLPTTEGRFTTKTDYAKVISTFASRIEFLNRVNAGKHTIVASDIRGNNVVVDVRGLASPAIVTNARIIESFENGAFFVGSPAGNGAPSVLMIGRKAGEKSLQVHPRNAKYLDRLVDAAC